MKAGAIDFLTKPVEGVVLRARVQEALKQCSILRNQTRLSQSTASRLAQLTEREREIMLLSIAGYSCKEIAAHLSISYRTVETHRTRIMQKTGASNMLERARDVALQVR